MIEGVDCDIGGKYNIHYNPIGHHRLNNGNSHVMKNGYILEID